MGSTHLAMGSHAMGSDYGLDTNEHPIVLWGPLWATMGSTMGSFKGLPQPLHGLGRWPTVANGPRSLGPRSLGPRSRPARALHAPCTRTCTCTCTCPCTCAPGPCCVPCARERVPRSPSSARKNARPPDPTILPLRRPGWARVTRATRATTICRTGRPRGGRGPVDEGH